MKFWDVLLFTVLGLTVTIGICGGVTFVVFVCRGVFDSLM